MGTRIELHVFDAGDVGALAAARRAIEAVDDALTIHRPSPTVALNDCLLAGQEAAVSDPLLRAALTEIADARAETGELFDPAAHGGEAGWDAITFDRDAGFISASRPLALDFGGFGKGFALDLATSALRAAGVTSAFLSAGESSVAVVGEHPLGGAWLCTIPDPCDPARTLLELELIDEALSISATIGDGTKAPERAPMLRPGNACPVTAACCTVAVAAGGARAEMLSTALLVADDGDLTPILAADPTRRFRFDLTAQPARRSAQ